MSAFLLFAIVDSDAKFYSNICILRPSSSWIDFCLSPFCWYNSWCGSFIETYVSYGRVQVGSISAPFCFLILPAGAFHHTLPSTWLLSAVWGLTSGGSISSESVFLTKVHPCCICISSIKSIFLFVEWWWGQAVVVESRPPVGLL